MEVDEEELIECINLDRSGEGESSKNSTKKLSPCHQRDQLQIVKSGVNEQEENRPISKSFYVVQENGKQTATTVTPTSIIKTMQLSALKDYLHCYRCYATFHKIQDLVQHFLDCTSKKYEDLNFSQFKDQEISKSKQNNTSSSSNNTNRKRINRSSSPEAQYKFSDKVQKSNPRNRNSFKSSPQKYHHLHHQRQREQQSSSFKSRRRSESPLSDRFSSPPSPIQSIISVSKQTPLIKINENDARLLLEAKMRGDEKRKNQRQALEQGPRTNVKLKKPKELSGTTTTTTRKKPGPKKQKNTAKQTLPWRCKQCPLKYSTKGELTQHVNAHDGIFPYKCTILGCDKAFSWKKSRSRHVEQHAKVPNYKPQARRGPHVKKEKQKESQDETGDES